MVVLNLVLGDWRVYSGGRMEHLDGVTMLRFKSFELQCVVEVL